MRSDLLDLTMQVHHYTERAVLASLDGEREAAVWLPLTHVEVALGERGVATITMPEWLAVEKGLV